MLLLYEQNCYIMNKIAVWAKRDLKKRGPKLTARLAAGVFSH